MPSNPYLVLTVLVSLVVLSVGLVGVVCTVRSVRAEVARLLASWRVSRVCRRNIRNPLWPLRATRVDAPFVCPLVDRVCPLFREREEAQRRELPRPVVA